MDYKTLSKITDSLGNDDIRKEAENLANALSSQGISAKVHKYFNDVIIDIPTDVNYKSYKDVSDFYNSLHIEDWLKDNGYNNWYGGVEDIDEDMASGLPDAKDVVGSCYIILHYDTNDYSGIEFPEHLK